LRRLTPNGAGKASTWRLPRRCGRRARRPDGRRIRQPTTGKTRFTALASGEIDMLSRNTTWTFSRDVDLKFEFVGVNYYDGQGFMVPKELGVSSAKDLDGATVCIQTGTTTELNLADFFRSNNMSYEPVPIETNAEAQQQYLAGACDVYTTDASGLAATRATFEDPDGARDSARDHLEGAARPAGAPRRQRMGRHRPLDRSTR
jgi:ABC-type amino acid transport substrate-binding protein